MTKSRDADVVDDLPISTAGRFSVDAVTSAPTQADSFRPKAYRQNSYSVRPKKMTARRGPHVPTVLQTATNDSVCHWRKRRCP
jgi:hypothetical protein